MCGYKQIIFHTTTATLRNNVYAQKREIYSALSPYVCVCMYTQTTKLVRVTLLIKYLKKSTTFTLAAAEEISKNKYINGGLFVSDLDDEVERSVQKSSVTSGSRLHIKVGAMIGTYIITERSENNNNGSLYAHWNTTRKRVGVCVPQGTVLPPHTTNNRTAHTNEPAQRQLNDDDDDDEFFAKATTLVREVVCAWFADSRCTSTSLVLLHALPITSLEARDAVCRISDDEDTHTGVLHLRVPVRKSAEMPPPSTTSTSSSSSWSAIFLPVRKWAKSASKCIHVAYYFLCVSQLSSVL